ISDFHGFFYNGLLEFLGITLSIHDDPLRYFHCIGQGFDAQILYRGLIDTHASFLLQSGEDVVTVSKRLGHSSPVMTLKIYGHLLPQKDRAAADKMGDILRRRSIL
ncbi:MAG: hypothetical protein WCC10_04545, partial [Tumebacillaceae bacterium]